MTEVGQGMGKQSLIGGHSVHGHFNAYRVACLISQYLALSRCKGYVQLGYLPRDIIFFAVAFTVKALPWILPLHTSILYFHCILPLRTYIRLEIPR